MDDQDKAQFTREIVGLNQFLGNGRTMEPESIRRYWRALQSLTVESFTRAIASAERTCKFMPKPVELLTLAGDTIELRCEAAWQLLLSAVSGWNTYDEIVVCDSALIAVIRSMGGLERLVNIPSNTFHAFERKVFFASYESLCGMVEGPAFVFRTRMGDLNASKEEWGFDYRPKRLGIGVPDGVDITKIKTRKQAGPVSIAEFIDNYTPKRID